MPDSRNQPTSRAREAIAPHRWPAIWKNHGRWLRKVLRARLRDEDQVDEVFQEIALTVTRKPDRWPDADKVAPWLYRVTLQQICLFRRRQKATRTSTSRPFSNELDEPMGSIEEPVLILVNRENKRAVRQALEQLGGQDREILFLKHAEGWTYDEISRHTGITKDKVIYRIGRARNRLRNAICSSFVVDQENL